MPGILIDYVSAITQHISLLLRVNSTHPNTLARVPHTYVIIRHQIDITLCNYKAFDETMNNYHAIYNSHHGTAILYQSKVAPAVRIIIVRKGTAGATFFGTS